MTQSTYVIAEIASAHEGDPDHALRLLDAAASTQADAVKFQIFCRDELMSKRHPRFESFGEIEITPEAWSELLKAAAATDMDVVAEVFDRRSLDLAGESGCVDSYKVPTSDISNHDFILAACATGKRLFIGVGGAIEGEIDQAVDWLRTECADAVLMHGVQSYPTLLEDTNLERLQGLKHRYGVPVGYADHVDAEEAGLRTLIPMMAVAAGATIVEKHMTDDRSRRGRDHYSSLNPDEFREFVALVRQVECVIGERDPALLPAEIRYREDMKRYAVAGGDLPADAELRESDITYKRIGRAGMTHSDMSRFLGRPLRVSKTADEPILEDDF